VGIGVFLEELRDSEVLLQAMALIGVGFAVKVVPSLSLVARRFSRRDSLAVGAILAGQLGVVIALADLDLDLGLITGGQRAGATMLVAVSVVVSLPAFGVLAKPLPVSTGT